jgi:hypothetical protein
MGITGKVSIESQPNSVEQGDYKRDSKSVDSTLGQTAGDSTLNPTLSLTLVSTEGSSLLFGRFTNDSFRKNTLYIRTLQVYSLP